MSMICTCAQPIADNSLNGSSCCQACGCPIDRDSSRPILRNERVVKLRVKKDRYAPCEYGSGRKRKFCCGN